MFLGRFSPGVQVVKPLSRRCTSSRLTAATLSSAAQDFHPAFLMPAPELLAEHACVRTEARGRRKPPRMGRSGGVKGGQIWAPNLCRKNPVGAAEGLFRMAPLRPLDRPVTNHLVLPPGPLAVPPHHASSRATGPALDPPRSGPGTGKGRPKAAPLRGGFTPRVPSRSARTSPVPGPRPGSRA